MGVQPRGKGVRQEMKTKEDTKNRARELVAVSPFGKVRVKKSFRTCSLPFDCPTIKEAPNGCADCIADAIVSLTKLDERNRMNKYLNDKLGYETVLSR
jgi:hypothetical protein